MPEKTFFFMVEGETEKHYLKWLEKQIDEVSPYRVRFDIVVSKNPFKRLKTLPKDEPVTVYIFFDIESQEPQHRRALQQFLDDVTRAPKNGGRFRLAYSNLTFDLWLILHKLDAFSPVISRKNYIRLINKAFGSSFRGMNEFKRKESLRKIFSGLSLKDVKAAISREKFIMAQKNRDFHPVEYKGFNYYREDPALTVGGVIEEILEKCGVTVPKDTSQSNGSRSSRG